MLRQLKVYHGKEIPKLVEPQCSLLQAEVWTGKALTLERVRRDVRDDSPSILIFENLEDAEQFARARVEEYPDVECHINDAGGKWVKRIVKPGHRRPITKPRYQWWKFWLWTFRP